MKNKCIKCQQIRKASGVSYLKCCKCKQKASDEIEKLLLKQEQASKDIIRTQSLEEAIETADEIERKLKECDLKSMTDEEALKEIADLANEIDLSWFK